MRKSFYLPGLLALCFVLFSATVKAAPVDTIFVLSSPVNDSVFPGYTAHFTVAAKDTPSATAINYNWQESTDGGASWTYYTFVGPTTDTTSTIAVTLPIGAPSGNMYRCIVFNADGSDTSGAAMLFIRAGNTPQITSNPRDTSVCSTASSVHFKVKAVDTAGSATILYTWFESGDAGVTWDSIMHDADTAFIKGKKTDSLTILTPALLHHNNYMFMAKMGTDSGLNSSTAATLHVDSTTGLSILGATEICRGSSTTLSSLSAGGTWMGRRPSVDTIDTAGVVYAVGPGVDTITYTIHNICGVVSTSIFEKVDTMLTSLPISGPDATCIGNVITLTNPNPGGVWSSLDPAVYVNSIGMVEGLHTGYAQVHYTITNVCNSVDAFYYVEIDTAADAGTISGPSAVCAGSWVSFSTTQSEGNWISSNSAIAVVDLDGNVTGISEGVAVISYYFSNACGISVATDTIHVSGTASHIMGLDSVGIGNTRLLTDSIPGGIWMSLDTTIAKVGSASGVVTGIATGTATVKYTVINTCGTSSATILMHVGTTTAGAIHGPDTVCRGFTITKADTLVAGGTWSSKHDSVATIDGVTGVVTGVTKGIDTVYYTYSNGFGTARVKSPVVVEQPAVDSIGHPSIFSMGGSYTLVGYVYIKDSVVIDSSHVGGVATPYAVDSSIWKVTQGTWTSSDPSVGIFISGPSSGYLVIHGVGITTITYSVTNRCGTTDTSFTIVIPFVVGVNNIANSTSTLNVYPNPSTGNFTVNIASGVNEQASVVVTNMVGEKVKEFTVPTNNATEMSIDLPDGVYFISATTSTGKYSAKVTITK